LEEIMGLFIKSKNVDVPETEQVAPGYDIKTFRLNKPLSKEIISAMASETLHAGGWVEAPPEPKIGDNPRRVNHRAVDADLCIGAIMPDRTIYAGISPDTDKPMYATPAVASLTMTFNQATEYVAEFNAHGHQDWRVPTKNELNVLFNNRAAIGGFDMSGSYPAGWYRSSSSDGRWYAWDQRFSDGLQVNDLKCIPLSVRLVRTEAPQSP
jgi:hypothetical protein